MGSSKFLRFLVASATSSGVCVIATGCGGDGGFRAAWTQNESGGSGAVAAGRGAAGTSAGSGGFAGGGSSGQAGSGGVAGDVVGGAAGSMSAAAGMAGASGNANAGMSGSAGVTSGGAGNGATGGGSGMAGKAGAAGTNTGGSAGTGGTRMTCTERCNADADCRIVSADAGYRCNTSVHRCERFGEPCRSSTECLPEASLWFFDCDSDTDCFFFSDERCVDVGGTGRCARVAASANGCSDTHPDEVTLPLFGTSGSVLVCADTSLTCDGGACVPGCASNADCSPARNGSICDTNARLCRCARDEDCGGAGVSRCAIATGRCECADTGDCSDVPNSNACQSGSCGCSGVSACNIERAFSGTTYVCE